MSKKIILITLLLLSICFAGLYIIDAPIKKTLPSEGLDLSYLGNTVIVCIPKVSTGIDWTIKAMYNMPEGVEKIKLSFRNVSFFVDEPYFHHHDFVFAGTYNSLTNTFVIDKWYTAGDIIKATRKDSYLDNYLYIREFVPFMLDYQIADVSKKCVIY